MTSTEKTRQWPLSIKILLPLLIGSFVIICLGWILFKDQYTRVMAEQNDRRTSAISNGIEQFSWIVGISPEMIRIVDSRGAEKDVEMISIFRLDSFAAVTNSGEELSTDTLTSTLARQFPPEVLQALHSGKALHGNYSNMELDDTDYIAIAPALLREHDTGKSVPGVIFIQIGMTDFLQDMHDNMRRVAIGFLFGLLQISALTYLLLQRYIFRPVHDIRETIARRTAGDESAYATVMYDDEIGVLAASFNALLTSLKTEKARLNSILDNMMQCVITIDKTGIVKTFNRWAEITFGYQAGEIIGSKINTLMPEPYRGEHDQYLRNYLQTGVAKIIGSGREVRGLKKDGQAFPMMLSVTEITIDNEPLFIGLAQDVTEHKKKDQELMSSFQEIHRAHIAATQAMEEARKAKEAADLANAAKSQFLANMSHELRTPLNSMLGMMRLLSETSLSSEQRGMAETVFQSSRNLLEIVNDILDLSKIEAGEMQLEHIGFDVIYIFDSVLHVLRPLAKEKNLRLESRFEKGAFPYLLGDSLRLTRVLTNMIGNAVKYTDRGHVEFRAFCRKLDDRHIELRCEVEDTGIGIAKEKLGSVFEKFVQADTSTTRKYGGTGLGLAITKELVELMGGTIGVESEIDKGSTFWFTIPFEITAQLSEEKRLRKSKRDKGTMPPGKARVLVAEDHPLNQIFIKKLMERFGVGYFEIVNNGQEAVNKYQQSPWDIILMDCHMPEKNGYDATEEIRTLEEKTGKHVSIVAMTANAMVGEKEKCLRYGMDDYISKPINIDEMQDILGQWLHFEDGNGKNSGQEPGTGVNPPVKLSQLHAITEGNKDMDQEFVRVFITQSDKNLKILGDCCTSGDNKQWCETAHMLKGGCGIIGAEALSQLCEQGQHFDGSAEDRAKLFDSIKREYERAKDFLKQNGLISET